MDTTNPTPERAPSPDQAPDQAPDPAAHSASLARYHRQMLLPGIGAAGQHRLAAARVLLVGCGALGTVIADQLVRAGVGTLVLVDRDLVELTNLQRQVLFDEEDARQSLPKAVAAAHRLRRVNAQVRIEEHVADLHAGNVEAFAAGATLLLDGTDNAETRYLINDVSIKHALPWVYGACTGTEGRVMAIRPGQSACLRCLFPEPPAVGELPTCDTAGVLGPAAAAVASLQSLAALKLLTGNESALGDDLLVFDFWQNRYRSIHLADARRADCPCCSLRRFDFLERPGAHLTAVLCGRQAVQLTPARGRIDLPTLRTRLASAGRVEEKPYFLRCWPADMNGVLMTIFPDGRMIIQGTTDVAQARSIAAKLIGT